MILYYIPCNELKILEKNKILNYSVMNYTFSTEVPGLDAASNTLIVSNADKLIMFIYENKTKLEYSDPEIRVGLVLKILLKANNYFEIDLLRPVIQDIEYLYTNESYLRLFSSPEERKKCLSKELILVNKYIELSETISLNRSTY